jgi:hypothetical protein
MNINIMGVDYRLELVKDCGKMNDNMGTWEAKTGMIQLLDGMPKDVQASTVLHEIIHALSFHMSLDLDEKQTKGLESGLFQVLKSNPELLNWMRL